MSPRYGTRPSDLTLQNGQTLGFRKKKGYYAKGQAIDPFASFSDPMINAHVKQVVGRLPMPRTDQQIQSQAQGMLDPVVAQITAGINARARAGGQAITGYTRGLADDLATSAPAGVTSAYAPAETATAAANAALADRLRDSGSHTADDLAVRLASINAPGATDAAAGAVRQAGAGSSNASYATGNAALEQLIGNHAHASEFASTLPSLARLTGAQQLGALQGRAQQDIRDETGQVLQQLPSIVQALRSENDTRSNNRAQVASDLYQFLTGQNTSRATAKAGLVSDATALDYKASADASDATKPDASLSRTYGYIVDSTGTAILDANGHKQKVAKTGTGKGGKGDDTKALSTARTKAVGIIKDNLKTHAKYTTQPKTDAFGGVIKDASGKPVMERVAVGSSAAGSYYDAIHQVETVVGPDLVAVGYTRAQITQFAQQLANAYWKPGQGGRPGK